MCLAASIAIAAQGKSDYSIVLPAKAPYSVTEAAAELQKDIQLATGAMLPIQVDSASTGPVTPSAKHFISLGATRQAKAAGFSADGMADEAYRIVTHGGNLYILGPDTPDGGWTKNNGISNGTADGVYVFLEDELGVRWLMPGEIGRDVPQRPVLELKEIDRSGAPMFNYRQLSPCYTYTNPQQYEKALAWMHHMRVGGSGGGHSVDFRGSANFSYGHYWWRTVNHGGSNRTDTAAVKALYQAHLDWFAMNHAGQRPPPANEHAKFETTNSDLVRWYAQQAIDRLKASGRPATYSLSPSDGSGWSQGPASKALYDPSPATLLDPEAKAGQPSMSSLVLKWYHDVAEVVQKEYPQGRLSGFIYAQYLYPPRKFQMKLPENFTPVLAFSPSYDFGLYRDKNQEIFQYVMDSWAKVAPSNWYFYSLPNQLLRQNTYDVGTSGQGVNFPGDSGIVVPAAPDILNLIFRTLVRDHITGTILYGVPSWSSSAMTNCIMAAMDWNPKLDAYDVQRDWLGRAYGPAAGKVMEGFYRDLNGWFADYYRQDKSNRHYLTLDKLRDIYARHYPELEKTYLQAAAQAMTAPQKERLELIGDNLIVLQWRLRNAGFLAAGFQSKLKRHDEQVIALISRPNSDFPMFPGAMQTDAYSWDPPKPFKWGVQWMDNSKAGPAGGDEFPSALAPGTIVLYATKDGPIRIEPELVTQSAYFASYWIKDQSGQKIAAGVLNKGTPVAFDGRAGQAYYLYVVPRNGVNYRLRINDAAVAQGNYNGRGKILRLSGRPAAVEILHIPGEVPIGVSEVDEGSVEIRKPFAGASAVDRMLRTGLYSEVRVLASLTDGWKFHPDPQDDLIKQGVTQLDFNDSDWSPIGTLNWWQMQGFPDYHGAAWYRVTFTMPPIKKGEQTRLYFESVDGNAEIYLNGQKIAEHKIGPPPEYKGWNQPFTPGVSHNAWKPGKNILAVKVTSKSATLASGITGGVAAIGRISKGQ
jgi:hypothetical protein